MNLYSDHKLLLDSLKILIGKSDNDRKKASQDIKGHVEAAARELSLERFANFESILYQTIFQYVHSEVLGAKLGGILAIRELIDCASAAAEEKVIKFANNLATALKVNTDFVLIELVADAFGYMAKYSPVSNIDYIESELHRSLEWIRCNVPHRRFAACAILQQLAENAPTFFFAKTKEFFDYIWDPLWDMKDQIRYAASKALSACLAVLSQRTYTLTWYCQIFEKIGEGLQKGTTETVHGSLLAVSEMLKHTNDFMIPRFTEMTTRIMKLKDHRSKTVRSSIIQLLPKLAQFCPDLFSLNHLNEAIEIVIKNYRIIELRPQALLATGKLCRAVGSHLVSRVEELASIIREALASTRNKKEKISAEILQCISDMVVGLGAPFHDVVLTLLEPMLQSGLTGQLIDTLNVISSYMPHQKLVVQQRLLEESTKILGGDTKITLVEPPYLYSWTHKEVKGNRRSEKNNKNNNGNSNTKSTINKLLRLKSSTSSKDLRNSFSFFRSSSSKSTSGSFQPPVAGSIAGLGIGSIGMYMSSPTNNKSRNNTLPVIDNPELILLALRTLETMSLPCNSLIRLVEQSVLPYIVAENLEIRKEAATTCAVMLASIPMKIRGPTADVTEEIISYLIQVVVTDPSSTVRLSVLKCLFPHFDRFLCREHHIQTLMFLLSDEYFDVRLESLKILGRLVQLNPSAILPLLRQLLRRLISEIKHSCDPRLKEEAVLSVSMFIRCSPSLHNIIKPFMGMLMKTLPLSNADVRLTTASLEGIGELCLVMGQDTAPFSNDLLQIIIPNMHDPTSRRKQEMSVKTLGQLVCATGLTISPYLQYPQLLPWALDLLSKNLSTSPWTLRMEVLRTLGLLGALEPRKYSIIINHLHEHEKKKLERKTIDDSNKLKDSKSKDGNDNLGVSMNDHSTYSGYDASVSRQERSDSVSINSGDKHDKFDSSKDSNRAVLICTEVLLEDYNADAPAHYYMYEQSVMKSLYEPLVSTDVVRKIPSNDDYFPHVAITALTKILKDSSLQIHHSSVTQAIMLIFKSLGMRSVPFLDKILPYLLELLRTCGPGLRESIIQQLSLLVSIVQYHITPYLESLFKIIQDYWYEDLQYVLCLVEEIAKTVSDSFSSSHVSTVLPLLLSSLTVPKGLDSLRNDSELKSLEQTLSCFNSLRSALQSHTHLVISALCKLMGQLQELGPASVRLQTAVVGTMRRVCTGAKGSLMEQSHMVVSSVIHCLVRAINYALESNVHPSSPLITECIRTFCALAKQLGPRLCTFDSFIMKSIDGRGIDISRYVELSNDMKNGTLSEYGYTDLEVIHNDISQLDSCSDLPLWNVHLQPSSGSVTSIQQHPLNQSQLSRSWDISQRSTAADWNEWLRRLKVDLLRESPSPVLRVCSALAQAYTPLAGALFHAAFVSCWNELNEQYKDSLVKALTTAFQSNTIPPEILQTLLNLAEFMEHDVEALPIALNILADLAQKGHAYAKALHYRELEFQTNPIGCFESLININKKLDQYDAAVGVLKVVGQMQENNSAHRVQEAWLAKVGNWGEAIDRYEQRLLINSKDSSAISGKLKCLDALGRWEEAVQICTESLDHLRIESETLKNSNHIKAAVLGGRAAWYLNQWDVMDTIVSQLPDKNVEGSFMRAVLAVHRENYDESRRLIEHTRKQLDQGLTALLAESYGRAYFPLIMVQQCSELEEIMSYRMFLRKAGITEPFNDAIRSYKADSSNNLSGNNTVSVATVDDHHYDGIIGSSVSSNGSNKSLKGNNSNLDSIPFVTNSYNKAKRDAYHSISINTVIDVIPTTASITDAPDSVACTEIMQEVRQRKVHLSEKWRKRIKGCCSSGRGAITVWKSLLNGRRMVLDEREDIDTWLDFASLCRNAGNIALADRVLKFIKTVTITPNRSSTNMVNDDELASIEKRVDLAVFEQSWAVGDKKAALAGLEHLCSTFSTSTNAPDVRSSVSSVNASVHLSCLLKIGEWKLALIGPGNSVDPATRKDILSLYSLATKVNPSSYLAWHQWGLCNYRAIEEARQIGNRNNSSSNSPGGPGATSNTSKSHMSSSNSLGLGIGSKIDRNKPTKSGPAYIPSIPHDVLVPLVTNAIAGLLRAISLGTRQNTASVMQDMLCVLSLWFKYSRMNEVYHALEIGLTTVHLDNWLGVLPQLIARIDHFDANARIQLHNLLKLIGERHAQALVYPLSVALKSPKGDRKEAAEHLMASLRQHSPKLITQALLVSHELVRVAILWQEVWHESLEEASKQYFGEGNIQAMLETLAPLHANLDVGPSTLRESSFVDAYGHDLNEAWDCLRSYRELMNQSHRPIPVSGAAPSKRGRQQVLPPDEMYLHQAWDLYYAVFKRINLQLPQVTSLDLNNCSPNLKDCRDLDLGIPGTYAVNGTAVKIRSFHPVIAIIRSKQRPRKIIIVGDNGKEFAFLLKGHEDLRQDERAMQLFGLVNALLHNERRTSGEAYELSIQRYAVIPLSPTAGLISWVPNCDTFHDLIRDFRESKKIMLNIEHKLIQQIAPNNLYDSLPHIHKIEVFNYALEKTNGEDLAKILWLKSETSEAWLQRRSNYTRSMAVMSMVGYVLGLGDRHPSNLMLDRGTGKVLHIDFGDCFEVAMQREKFPEKVPFRLTRMLVKAMELSGIEGSYRLTCEEVMGVLRANKDSLVATLEAFVHDPLISWRLLNTGKAKVRKGPEAKQQQQQQTSRTPSAVTSKTTTPTSSTIINNTSSSSSSSSTAALVSASPNSMMKQRLTPTLERVIETNSDFHDVNEAVDAITDSVSIVGVTNTNAGMANADGSVIVAIGSYHTDLHLQMSSLANTVSMSPQRRTSYSVAHHSIRSLSIAQKLEPVDAAVDAYDARYEEDNELTDKAVVVIRRVMDKLTGLDYDRSKQAALTIPEQVDLLIQQATSIDNLSLAFMGWCSWW